MRLALTCLIILAAGEIASMSPAHAQSRCERLWIARNSIYKEAGYCFKTARAISYFGNAGCRYDSESGVPLSRRDRARIASIRAEERGLGCTD